MPLLRSLALVLPMWLIGAAGGGVRAATAERTDDPAHCLALALYFEAKTEGAEGMRAVAAVILNRVADARFPDTVCAVIQEGGETPPCQFSWWCDGESNRPDETRAWVLARGLAEGLVEYPPLDPTGGALFFHSTDIATPWLRTRERTVQIGRHVFYR